MASISTSVNFQPRVQRNIDDRDYGREEYIDDCVRKVQEQGLCLVSFGGLHTLSYLPPILQHKYSQGRADLKSSVFFPGFTGAENEVEQKLKDLGIKFFRKEFRGGSNSDALGLIGTPYDLDGYYYHLDRKQKK